MIRKIVAIWVSLAMLFGLVVIVDIVTDFTPTVKATTLYVNETGSGGAYTSIQDAIDAANPWDTVFVYNGTYFETIIIDKTVELIGEDMYNTTIDGEKEDDVVYITGNEVTVSGFTIINAKTSSDNAGIKLAGAQNCTILNNNISVLYCGIFCMYGLKNNYINNLVTSERGIHIRFSSEQNLIGNVMIGGGLDILNPYALNIGIPMKSIPQI